jgi:nucleoside-diphosphate-sugar epimerase
VSTGEVAAAFLHLVEHPTAGCHVINVASRWQKSIGEIAEMVAAAHRERTGAPLPVEVLADIPATNDFVLESRLDFLQPTPDESAREMALVIRRLFDRFT